MNNIFDTPAFDTIKDDDYKVLFEESIAKAKIEIDQIVDNAENPTFDNTIKALEFVGRDFSRIASIFYNLNAANTSPIMQKTAQEIAPLVTEYSMYSLLNEGLFERIKIVMEECQKSPIKDKEDSRLLNKTYESFVLNGANLKKKDRKRYSDIIERLSILSLQFEENLLAATNKFYLHLTTESEIDGLPNYVKEMGSAEAKSRDKDGWIFTLQNHSYSAFIQHSSRRELREELWRQYSSRCNEGEFNNNEIIQEIVKLRIEKANLLGFNTYSEYALTNRMAKKPSTVNSFLSELMDRSYPFAQKDLKKIQDFAISIGFNDNLMPWDFPYYSEKYKKVKFSIDDETLKPYFSLENVKSAVFNLANKLFGLNFIKNENISKYHNDVEVYEVYDEKEVFISLLYLDFFPRANKSGGAWMTSFREQGIYNGIEERPFVSLVCNFSKPTESSPSLLSFSEVTTLLHEFGHGLHGMLAKGKYPSLTGTNVARDFVELPSQIMENWAYEKDFLNWFAFHYETNEPIPDELVRKIIESKNFNSGYASVRQLRFGINDMAWHDLKSSPNLEVEEFENTALAEYNILPNIQGFSFSPTFAHIFAGGYAAGYYSYKWAEVLEADAFSLFKENGIFNPEIAQLFKDEILSKGSIEDEEILFRNFRGRDPKSDALFIKTGMQ